MYLFRQLSEAEEAGFRAWARKNYTPFEPIKGIWHPVTQAECVKMNVETGFSPEPSIAVENEA